MGTRLISKYDNVSIIASAIVSFVYQADDFLVKSSSAIVERIEKKRRGLVSRFEELEEIHEEKMDGVRVVKEPSADVAGNPCVRPTELAVAHLAVSVFALHFARILCGTQRSSPTSLSTLFHASYAFFFFFIPPLIHTSLYTSFFLCLIVSLFFFFCSSVYFFFFLSLIHSDQLLLFVV